ncbi:hypothetical protein SFC65_24405 [Priestia filamentosa]|uniref:hypothetical protein n=1 Tax=Priestia filamentosa TaxID=1402861 RepID=UPI00398282C8
MRTGLIEERIGSIRTLLLVAFQFSKEAPSIEGQFATEVFSSFENALAQSKEETNFFKQKLDTVKDKILLLQEKPYDLFKDSAVTNGLKTLDIKNEPFLVGFEFNKVHLDALMDLKQEIATNLGGIEAETLVSGEETGGYNGTGKSLDKNKTAQIIDFFEARKSKQLTKL